jgi:hypothetical protein
VPLACGIVSCATGGVLSDAAVRRWGSPKWGRRLSGILGLALAGTGTLLIPWVGNMWLLGVVIGGAFFFSDLNMGPAWAAAADIGGRAAGTVSGAMNMLGAFAGAAGMAFAGRLFAQGRADVVFIVFGVAYALAAGCWLAVDVSRPLAASPQGPISLNPASPCTVSDPVEV